MDLAAWVRQRRVVALLELVDQLPEASRTREAILQDPTLQHVDADAQTGAARWRPALRDYDLHAQLLRLLVNTVSAALGDRGEVVPGPWTAAQEQQAIAVAAYADALIRDVAPHAWRQQPS